ncbi:MAG: hypothetical protein HWD61_07110 [Parachlamydiaceae bacterium]|nr:MAG: hypothetical protein HWD61_07110 [Parachlamydiaceae bacterium]
MKDLEINNENEGVEILDSLSKEIQMAIFEHFDPDELLHENFEENFDIKRIKEPIEKYLKINNEAKSKGACLIQ